MENSAPNYKTIYEDILNKDFPYKKEECSSILCKENLSVQDVIKLNRKIFGTNKYSEKKNQQHRSYAKSDILKILDYQKKNGCNNVQLANHFGLSRNTVAKWKKLFLV